MTLFFAKLRRMTHSRGYLLVVALICLVSLALADEKKTAAPAASVTGRFEGTAKNKAEEVIPVALELTEKDGAISGMIRSTHGDFTITGDSHKDDAVNLEFDAGGPVGSITLKMTEDKLVGTWTAGDDGGDISVKKAAAQEGGAKDKA